MSDFAMELSDIDPIEYCIIKTNPAVKTARRIINRHTIPRAEKEDTEIENINKIDSGYRICYKCSLEGNKMKYPYDIMKRIERKTVCRGKPVILYVYLCPKHQETYKSNSERVGGKNF